MTRLYIVYCIILSSFNKPKGQYLQTKRPILKSVFVYNGGGQEIVSDYCSTLRTRSFHLLTQINIHFAPCYFGVPLRFSLRKILWTLHQVGSNPNFENFQINKRMGLTHPFIYEKTPQVGLEPTTYRLTAGCSAIELLRIKSVNQLYLIILTNKFFL